MTVFRDSADWLRNGVQSGHMISEDLDELHRIATLLELSRRYWMGDALTPHYQLPERLHAKAEELGVVALDRPKFMQMVARVNNALDAKRRASIRTQGTQRPARTEVQRAPQAASPEQPSLL